MSADRTKAGGDARDPKPTAKRDRAEREAAALRANLAKRKTQQRQRRDRAVQMPPDGSAVADNETD